MVQTYIDGGPVFGDLSILAYLSTETSRWDEAAPLHIPEDLMSLIANEVAAIHGSWGIFGCTEEWDLAQPTDTDTAIRRLHPTLRRLGRRQRWTWKARELLFHDWSDAVRHWDAFLEERARQVRERRRVTPKVRDAVSEWDGAWCN